MVRLTLYVGGMTGDICVGKVRAALTNILGVTVEQVKVGTATVRYDPAVSNPAALRAVVAKAGFTAST